jgi:hypothetical protein
MVQKAVPFLIGITALFGGYIRVFKASQYSVETVLVLGSSLPKRLQSLRNALWVSVIETLDIN